MSAAKKSLVAVVGATAAALLFVLTPMLEGEIRRGHLDPLGIPTKCMGDTRDVELGRVYTAAECRDSMGDALVAHCAPVMSSLPALKGRPFAIVGTCLFAYNAGVGAWRNSDALRWGKRGDFARMCRALQISDKGTFHYSTGKDRRTGLRVQLPGLVKRRQIERMVCEMDAGAFDAWTPGSPAMREFEKAMREYKALETELQAYEVAP